MDTKRESLITRIAELFPDPGYPEDRRTCPHRCEECDELDAVFRGKQWHDVAKMPMLPLHGASSLLSDDVFAYFLPGLMIGCLLDPDAADITLDFIAYGFLDSPLRLGVIEELGPEQRTSFYEFLEWWLDENEGWREKYQRLVAKIPPDVDFKLEALPSR